MALFYETHGLWKVSFGEELPPGQSHGTLQNNE